MPRWFSYCGWNVTAGSTASLSRIRAVDDHGVGSIEHSDTLGLRLELACRREVFIENLGVS